MRLLHTSSLHLEEFEGSDVPPYAILSHRWQKQEVTYKDFLQGGFHGKKGYEKIVGACNRARQHRYDWIWIDTCCIDKSSSAELSEAINSMYRWYEGAEWCVAYLGDVPDNIFEESLWFTRGWTLQELIAPSEMSFFDSLWNPIGEKTDIANTLSAVAGIPTDVLLDHTKLDDIPAAIKMSWAARRETKRIEDVAYSLLGIFNINMPMLYGEAEKAFERLQQEIIKQSDDSSLFLWNEESASQQREPLFATSPKAFQYLLQATGVKASLLNGVLVQRERASFALGNSGLSIELQLLPWTYCIYLALLPDHACRAQTSSPGRLPFIALRYELDRNRYVRCRLDEASLTFLPGKVQAEDIVWSQYIRYRQRLYFQRLTSKNLSSEKGVAPDPVDLSFSRYDFVLRAVTISLRASAKLQYSFHGLRLILGPGLLGAPDALLMPISSHYQSIDFPSAPGVEHLIGSFRFAKDQNTSVYLALDSDFDPIILTSESEDVEDLWRQARTRRVTIREIQEARLLVDIYYLKSTYYERNLTWISSIDCTVCAYRGNTRIAVGIDTIELSRQGVNVQLVAESSDELQTSTSLTGDAVHMNMYANATASHKSKPRRGSIAGDSTAN